MCVPFYRVCIRKCTCVCVFYLACFYLSFIDEKAVIATCICGWLLIQYYYYYYYLPDNMAHRPFWENKTSPTLLIATASEHGKIHEGSDINKPKHTHLELAWWCTGVISRGQTCVPTNSIESFRLNRFIFPQNWLKWLNSFSKLVDWWLSQFVFIRVGDLIDRLRATCIIESIPLIPKY